MPSCFPLDQRVAPDEITFVQVNAEAKSAFVGSFGDGNVGCEIAISFFKTQRIQNFVPADFNSKFLACFHQHVKDHRGAVVRDIKFPAQLARVTDSLGVHPSPIDVDQLRR